MNFHLWVQSLAQTNNPNYIGERCQVPQIWDAALDAAVATLAPELEFISQDRNPARRKKKLEDLISTLRSTRVNRAPVRNATPDEVNRLIRCIREIPDHVKLAQLAKDLKTRTFTDAEVFGQTPPTSESGTETPSSS